MNKEEYIKQCGARTSKGLSAEQVLSYFLQGYGGVQNQISAMRIKQGRLFGLEIDRAKGVAMLRQAFDFNKVLEVHFVEGEGIIRDGESLSAPHILMKFRQIAK